MATRLPLDSSALVIETTGKYRPVAKYGELADGQRRRVPGAQETDDAGVPLWQVDVELVDESSTSDRTVIHSVKLASAIEPAPIRHERAHFDGLTCLPYVDRRTGQVGLSFQATGMAFPQASAPRRSKTDAGGE